MQAGHLETLIHLMGMPASDLIIPSHVFLPPILGIIAAVAIIEAVVPATIKVAVVVTKVYTIPREAILVTDVTGAAPGGGLIHRILLTPNHLADIPASPDLHLNLTEGVDLIHTVAVGPDHLGEGMAAVHKVIMAQSLQITNALDVPPDLQGSLIVNHQSSRIQSSAIKTIQ